MRYIMRESTGEKFLWAEGITAKTGFKEVVNLGFLEKTRIILGYVKRRPRQLWRQYKRFPRNMQYPFNQTRIPKIIWWLVSDEVYELQKAVLEQGRLADENWRYKELIQEEYKEIRKRDHELFEKKLAEWKQRCDQRDEIIGGLEEMTDGQSDHIEKMEAVYKKYERLANIREKKLKEKVKGLKEEIMVGKGKR